MRKYKITGILLISIILITCVSFNLNKNKQTESPNNVIEVYKFLGLDTYPFSITEEMFWENKNLEHVKMNMPDIFIEGIVKDVQKTEQIKHNGLSEDFDFAFVTTNNQDTIYASLIKNLWTLKKNGKIEYYRDNDEDLKKTLQEYSSFFSNCW
ncbi:hypothetical protein [Aquimarina algiphila]|uniref:Uncharacterized protein n=1 Tax=Aquimarina algiphila TaxID=2047982 RepID=A0A554VAJ4_9FLAO|nr:hypothetical protein [Aquimarina algiphila]TSE03154.1 hypothetical protein FOF46_29910 [Aquimarina algiphila]